MKPTLVPQNMTDKQQCHPEETHKSFIFDTILVKWINPIINVAYKEPLEESDVWPLDHTDMSVQHHATLLSAAWKEECRRTQERGRSGASSLRDVILRVYRRDILVGGGYQLLFFVLQLMQPFIIGRLLEYLAGDGSSSGGGGVGTGIMWALILGGVAFLSSNALILAFANNRRFGTFVRAALMMNIYEHSMHITNASRMKNDIGTTTNLMAIDSEKVFFAVQYLHFLWHGPLTIVVVMVILMTQIGFVPAAVGMVAVALTIPVQSQCARMIGSLRRQMVSITDARVALISEALQVIRAVKLYAWEDLLFARVAGLRALEIGKMWRYLVSSALLRDVNQVSPVITCCLIVCTLVFVVYSDHPSGDTDSSINGGSRDSGRLTTTRAVTILAYLNIIRFPLQLLGVSLKLVVDGGVSLARLNSFFLLEVLPARDEGTESVGGGEVSVVFTHASFSWGAREQEGGEGGERDGDGGHEEEEGGSVRGQLYKQVVHSPLQPAPLAAASLNDLHISLRAGELVALIGAVGSGKSNFIAAVLGEMPCTRGGCSVRGGVAYSAQTPWIQNMTVRDNILFGADQSRLNAEEQYQGCLRQAALSADLENLPHGDETEIGERGINLSGGQKSRVSFCRALLAAHSREVVLLDDPFSSVDGQTGNWMFSQGVLEGLRGKLRLVALNSHLHLLPLFDRVLVMHEGRVVVQASPQELFSTHKEVYERVLGSLQHQHQHQLLPEEEHIPATGQQVAEEDAQEEKKKEAEFSSATTGEQHAPRDRLDSEEPPGGGLELAVLSRSSSKHPGELLPPQKQANEGLVVTEARSTNAVSVHTYFGYFGAAFWTEETTPQSARAMTPASMAACGLVLFSFLLAQAARVYCDVVLLQWVGAHEAEGSSPHFKLYLVSIAVFVLLIALRSCVLTLYASAVCRSIHDLLFRKVLRAPVPLFFDVTAAGSVLNKFAKDMETADVTIPEFLNMFLFQVFSLLSVVALCVWSVPAFALLVLPIVAVVLRVFLRFAPFSRDIKRLESVSRTPVYSSFSETLTGLETIRAYGAAERFLGEHLRRMDTNHKLFYHLTMGQCWLTARMELSGVYFLVSISVLAVLVKEFAAVSESKVGLAMVYTLQLTAMFQRCVQLAMDLQTHFTSVERIVQFIDIPQESSTLSTKGALSLGRHKMHSDELGHEEGSGQPPGDLEAGLEGQGLPPGWPAKGGGTIAFHDLWMRYRPNTPFVMRGVTFGVRAGERVGICGRTGAGKSSIIQALFRIVEAQSGRVEVCGVDTRRVPLSRLRSVLAIIPQDPVLLRGPIRYQLDPFEQHADAEVWAALGQVNMAAVVRALPGGLAEPVAEGGDSLSQGEKQLLCIARALLRRAQILVLDEATSACDPATDEAIQRALRAECALHGTTVLTIAHRLHTILDFDKVLVMRAGRVAEFASPAELLADSASQFSQMMSDYYNASHRQII